MTRLGHREHRPWDRLVISPQRTSPFTVDILPQLAMHSAFAGGGAADEHLIRAMTAYFSASFHYDSDGGILL